jgi:hypothetical protein
MSEIPRPGGGKMMVDEDVWMRLVGEPGRQMQEGHRSYLDGDFGRSAIALRSVGVFLHVAKENAEDPIALPLRASAVELDQLSDRVTGGRVLHADVLGGAFARAHHALAQHYAVKASRALSQNRLTRAANYLCSAVNHAERSASWCGQALGPETKGVINKSREIVSLLRRGGPDVFGEANAIITRLHARLAEVAHVLPTQPAA